MRNMVYVIYEVGEFHGCKKLIYNFFKIYIETGNELYNFFLNMELRVINFMGY